MAFTSPLIVVYIFHNVNYATASVLPLPQLTNSEEFTGTTVQGTSFPTVSNIQGQRQVLKQVGNPDIAVK